MKWEEYLLLNCIEYSNNIIPYINYRLYERVILQSLFIESGKNI